MKSLNIWIFLAIIVLIIGLIFYSIQTNVEKPNSIDNAIIYSLITALTAIITVMGSIYVNQSISAESSRNQRLVEISKMKQDYYHKFTESFMLRMAYIQTRILLNLKKLIRLFALRKIDYHCMLHRKL